MAKQLGRIKHVELRDIFSNEATEFTPWLEKHIDELSEKIGIEIQDIHRETEVGDFNCDLIGSEVNSEDKVIIENQLDSTNHEHLGKLITYASGLGARYVVWVARKIREEHQKALEWLNENVNDISFFGVEISGINIDDSKPALEFNLVVEPNEWSNELKQNTRHIDERHQKYQQFFAMLILEYEKNNLGWAHLTARPAHWIAFGAGKTGFRFVWAFRSDSRFGVELYIDTKDKDEIKAYFAEISKYKEEIDAQIPDLSWEELPDRRGSRITVYFKMPATIKNLNDIQINEVIKWAIYQMRLFKKVFSPYILKLE